MSPPNTRGLISPPACDDNKEEEEEEEEEGGFRGDRAPDRLLTSTPAPLLVVVVADTGLPFGVRAG